MIKESDFAKWLEDPITKKLTKYVYDALKVEELTIIDLIADITPHKISERVYGVYAGAIKTLENLLELTAEDINHFYGEEEDEGEEGQDND